LIDLHAARTFTIDLARQAGAALIQLYNQPHELTHKGSRYDFLTEGDRAAESIIVAGLRAAYPDHRIVSEEGAGADAERDDAAYRWYIDPIDGTINFAHDLPHFAISIALTDADDMPLMGVVYAPMYDEMYSAVRGAGADMNRTPLRVSDTLDLEDAVFASGFAYSRHTDFDTNVGNWGRMVMICRAMRQLGAASLDICFVASGRIDGYWETALKPWDYMAGALILKEAGGSISDFDGLPDGMTRGEILASNGRLHDRMCERIGERKFSIPPLLGVD